MPLYEDELNERLLANASLRHEAELAWDYLQAERLEFVENAKFQRDRTVWNLRKAVSHLTILANQSGWPTRTNDQWLAVLYWATLGVPNDASLFQYTTMPLYPAAKMLKLAEDILKVPMSYVNLYPHYRTAMIQLQTKGR